MEIDKMQIAQLHQLYGELTLQLELLSQKHNQVKSQIMKKAQEMQQTQLAAQKEFELSRAKQTCDVDKCAPELNGAVEAA